MGKQGGKIRDLIDEKFPKVDKETRKKTKNLLLFCRE